MLPGREPLMVPNSGTTAGVEDIVSAIFLGSGGGHSWYMGLIDDVDWSATSVDDTIGSHPGWIEFSDYKYQGVSQRIGPLTITPTKDTGNPPFMQISFDSVLNGVRFTADGKVRGMFLCNNATQGGSTGLLMSTGAMFPASDVVAGDRATTSYRFVVNGVANSKTWP